MVKTILSQVKEYKRVSILTPVCMLGEVIMEMIIPLLMASIIDKGVSAGDIHHIKVTGIPIDLVRALATFLFLWLTAEPLLQKLDRIKTKYGLAE